MRTKLNFCDHEADASKEAVECLTYRRYSNVLLLRNYGTYLCILQRERVACV